MNRHNELTAVEAAERLGLHRHTVTAMVQDGRLAGEKGPDGRWRIPESAVQRLQDERATLTAAAQGLQGAGALLRDLARRRWEVAEAATAELARALLKARGEAEEALEAGRPEAVELAEAYHECLDALCRQIDRLRETEAVVETADDLHAGGVKQERRETPFVLFDGSPSIN